VSAQAKPISEVVKDFEQSLENLRPSTRRVYVAGARAAFRAAPRSGGFRSSEISTGLFVEHHLKILVEQGGECATCPWQQATVGCAAAKPAPVKEHGPQEGGGPEINGTIPVNKSNKNVKWVASAKST
jgi:hypothetical protein